jgi:hypothetical protein
VHQAAVAGRAPEQAFQEGAERIPRLDSAGSVVLPQQRLNLFEHRRIDDGFVFPSKDLVLVPYLAGICHVRGIEPDGAGVMVQSLNVAVSNPPLRITLACAAGAHARVARITRDAVRV